MTPSKGWIVFDGYSVDLESREFGYEGLRIPLQEKPFRLLRALLEQPGRVITRVELQDALWPAELHVDREAGLNTAVRKLRSALRDATGGDCELLETVPRAGYRLRVGESRAVSHEPPPRRTSSSNGTARAFLTRSAPLPVFAVLIISLVLFGSFWGERGAGTLPEPMPGDRELRALYLEARSLLWALGGDLSRARELLRSVTRDVPEFAPAYAYLAETSARLAVRSGKAADLEEARRTAHRALEIDSGSAVAHRVLALVALIFDWDIQSAGARLALALELDPADPENHLAHASYQSALGRHEEAIAAVRQAVDLEPESMLIRSDAGYFLIRAGRFREAVQECEIVLRLDPENSYARTCLLTAYRSTGDFDSARVYAVQLLKRGGASDAVIEKAKAARDPRRIYLGWKLEQLLVRPERSALEIAIHYLSLGDASNAMPWLEKAARERTPLLIFVPQHAEFAWLHNEPRFREILQKSGLETFAAKHGQNAGPIAVNT